MMHCHVWGVKMGAKVCSVPSSVFSRWRNLNHDNSQALVPTRSHIAMAQPKCLTDIFGLPVLGFDECTKM